MDAARLLHMERSGTNQKINPKRDKPWFYTQCLEIRKMKKNLCRKWCKSNDSNVGDWYFQIKIDYKKLCDHKKDLIRHSLSLVNSPKIFWNTVNKLKKKHYLLHSMRNSWIILRWNLPSKTSDCEYLHECMAPIPRQRHNIHWNSKHST